jgi:transposase
MSHEIQATHERVDEIPVLVALLLKLRVAELIDKHFPTNGNRTGLSLGSMCVVWLTFILSQAEHRLNRVEPWVGEHRRTLSRCLGQEVEPRDCTDDRLARGLDYLHVEDNWQSFEADLNGSVIRTYDLRTDRVRLDSTSASAYVTPEGLFQFGHSKDHRPDLPQVKISLSVLDGVGLPLTTTVVAGNSADDPLYLPEIAKVRESIGHSGITYLGDCKMSALATRADIAAHGDYYLCPLSAVQVPAAEGERLFEPVWSGQQALIEVYPWVQDAAVVEPQDPLAVGYETTLRMTGQDAAGQTLGWEERRLVIRSLSYAKSQTQTLRDRLARAQEEIQALNERKQGKPRLRSREHAREAAPRIAEQHRVHEFLNLHLDCTVHERTRRAYGARPATSVREEQFTVTATVQETAVEEAIRRFGWRVYATNQDPLTLPLAKAVPAYREQYVIEQGFGRLKGLPLSLTPFYLQQEHRIMGLILLLTIALRVLMLAQFVARERLAVLGQKLSGIYAGQPGRQTNRPTTEMMLHAFHGVTLFSITVDGKTQGYLTPLSPTQKRILSLLGLSARIYSNLLPTISET